MISVTDQALLRLAARRGGMDARNIQRAWDDASESERAELLALALADVRVGDFYVINPGEAA